MCNDGATKHQTTATSEADREFRARLRFISIVLLVIFPLGWTAWFFPFDDFFDRSNTQLGGDYPVFHVMARMSADGKWNKLYDFTEQSEEIRRFLPGFAKEKFLPAMYPPWVPATLLPLGWLPYWASYVVFFASSLGILVLTLFVWNHRLEVMRSSWGGCIWLAAFALPVTCEVLVSGQASMIALGLYGIAAALILQSSSLPSSLARGKNEVLVGALLALAAYKPNVLGLVVLGVIIRWPRTLVGLIPTLLLWIGLAWAIGGTEAFTSYYAMVTAPETRTAVGEPPMHKFPTFAASTPWTRSSSLARPVCLVAMAFTVVALALWARRHKDRATTASFLSLLGIGQILGNPYLPVYDLAILVPIAVLIAEACYCRFGETLGSRSKLAGLMVGLLFFGPHLSQAIAQSTGFHVFTWLLIPVGCWVWRLANAQKSRLRDNGTQARV